MSAQESESKDHANNAPTTTVSADLKLTWSVEKLADDLFGHPGAWLSAPHPMLGGRRPNELVGTAEEFRVRNLLIALGQGLY